jgi:uncharacterized repeat protein (TIGR01451 family)
VGTGKSRALSAGRLLRRWSYALALSCAVAPVPAAALGTAAGEDVTNTVVATWTEGGGAAGPISDTVTFFVDELIDVDVTLQNAGPVVTTAGATGEVLTFLVTNVGNGVESFRLSQITALLGDDFDPIPAGIFLDSNGNGALDGADLAYAPGVNDPVLDANTPGAESVTVFLVNDIPAAPPPASGDLGDAELTATANAHAGAPGSFTAGAGDGGTDAVAGASGGADPDLGSYLVSDTSVQVLKSAAVDDGSGGANPIPGALITYSLDVTVGGTDTATAVVITDPIPTNTTYQAGTILLNGGSLTDVGGDDVGDFNATNPGEITVTLGDLDSTSPTQTITFQVRIN